MALWPAPRGRMDDWSVSDTARAAARGQATNLTQPVTLTQARLFMDDSHRSITHAALGASAVVGGRPEPSADLLRQLDDDPLGVAPPPLHSRRSASYVRDRSGGGATITELIPAA
jgi:hypothetical protein